MATKQEVYESLHALVRQAYNYATSVDLGPERIEAFELCEALRRLQRRGAAGEMLSATNPLLNCNFEEDEEEDDQ